METVWYILLLLMISTYLVLDGFDLGIGVLHLFLAKKQVGTKNRLSNRLRPSGMEMKSG